MKNRECKAYRVVVGSSAMVSHVQPVVETPSNVTARSDIRDEAIVH
jgi:hypothetical protein